MKSIYIAGKCHGHSFLNFLDPLLCTPNFLTKTTTMIGTDILHTKKTFWVTSVRKLDNKKNTRLKECFKTTFGTFNLVFYQVSLNWSLHYFWCMFEAEALVKKQINIYCRYPHKQITYHKIPSPKVTTLITFRISSLWGLLLSWVHYF